MGGKSTLSFKYLLFGFILIFISPIFMISSPVLAQDNEEEFTLEEVVVTGSRIQRRDAQSNSPIVTIEADQFEQQSGLNIEAYVNKLPEYNPAASPTTLQGDVQITPINSVGIATISLRGFGANRSLTLIDGKRGVPVNALMVTDINGIPGAMVERMETISGGASAVYGADAVGGVTNFILRKNFEGAEIDTHYTMPEAGDGDENRVSLLLGANLAEGRGNITFGAERYDRKVAYSRERDWYTDRWADPYAPGGMFLWGVNNYTCGGGDCPNWGAVKSLFGGQNPSGWFNAALPDSASMPGGFFGVTLQFSPDGQHIWVNGNPTGISRSGISFTDGLTYQGQYGLDGQDPLGEATYMGIKYNHLEEWASGSQERYSFYANGHYDLTDKITVFGTARYAQSKTATHLFGTNAIGGWEATVPYNPTIDSPVDPTIDYTDPAVLAAVAADPAAFLAANPNPNFIATGEDGAGHPVPAELAYLLNTRPDPSARWQPNWNPDKSLPPRTTLDTIQVYQIETGLNFELPFDWTGEAYYSHGESDTYNTAGGNMSLARYRALINHPDWGRGEGTGNQYYAVESEDGREIVTTFRPAFGVGDYVCTSGLYNSIFGDQPMSEDCFNALNALLQTRTEMTQDIFELNLQGGLFDLPAGEVRSAIGYQYRKVHGVFNPDILQSEDSFTDQVVGVYPTGYLDAKTHVNDIYAEALIPILSDLPFMEKLELELGARYSDYKETVGDAEYTYKALASWQPTKWLRFRGGYNRATRAPNLGELFLHQQEIFTGGGNFGDPCSPRANAPWGAGGTTLATDEVISATETAPALAPGQTLAGADYTEQLCEAMMGAVAADDFYRGIVEGVDTDRNFAAQGAGSPFAWVLQEGNPNLDPETADTWTMGFVMNSPFESALLSGISLSFDYYDIKIEDAIMTYSIDYANYRCFGTGMEAGLTPAEQALTPGCVLVPRDQNNGSALNTKLSYDNQATIDTSGFDIMLNWHADMAAMGIDFIPGFINLNVKATVLDSYVTRQSPASFDVPIEWKGSFGPNLPGTNGGSYNYRLNTTLTYNNVRYPWSVSLFWRHLPGIWAAGHAEQKALIKNNASVAAGGDGITLGYTPRTDIKNDSYDTFDFNGTWDINDTFTVRFGITNLFDKAPLTTGAIAGYAPGTDLTAVCSAEEETQGCSDPTAYSLYNPGNAFNGGYYDVIGRSYFVGVKARF